MEKCEMILLRQAKKQGWSLFLRQKWGGGKGKNFWGNFSFGKKNPRNYNTLQSAFVSSPLLTLCLFLTESLKQIVRNIGTVRVRLWWSSFRKSPFPVEKNQGENSPELKKQQTLDIASVAPKEKRLHNMPLTVH